MKSPTLDEHDHSQSQRCVYEIRDANGGVVAEHVRHDYPDGCKKLWWRRNGSNGLDGLALAELPLYGSHELGGAVSNTPLILVEGEKARDALKAHGFRAVGTVCGASSVPGDEALAVCRGSDTVLWPDNDEPGFGHMRRVRARLVALGVTPRVFDWQDAPTSGDAVDFFARGGTADDLTRLLDSAVPFFDPDSALGGSLPDEVITAVRLKTHTWCELVAAADAEPPRELVEGHVSEGDVVVVYGFTGVGKSLFVIDLSVSIHRRDKFLGRFATAGTRVGLVDEETGDPRRLGRRLAQFASGRGIDPADADMPVFSVGQRARLDTREGLEHIYAWIDQNRLSVLVIDTLRRVHQLRENEADDMAKLEAAIKDLQRRVRDNLGRALTVILIHHSPKPRVGGSNAAETMARGSGDILAGADAAFYLRKGREKHEIVVEHAKARWGEQMPPYRVRIEGGDDEVGVAYVGSVNDVSGKEDHANALFRSVLAEGGPHGRPDLLSRAKAEGISESTADRVLKGLVKAGEALTGRDGKVTTYAPTELLVL